MMIRSRETVPGHAPRHDHAAIWLARECGDAALNFAGVACADGKQLHLRIMAHEPRDVAGWPRKTVDESGGDRVGDQDEHDRYVRGRWLQCRAQRYSLATFALDIAGFIQAATGIVVCCARAASGHAAGDG